MLRRVGHNNTSIDDRARRMRNALWGLFIGDALAMPAHWFYSIENIKRVFDGGLTGFEPAPHPHPESFMVGMTYRPDVENAKRLERPFDILHDHARFYDTSYGRLEIATGERESEHGNATPTLEDRYHYHHGLKAGENTLGANLVRVLMRSVAEHGRYEPDAFLEAFVDYMTTPGLNRDPYTEIYLRRWFENYSTGLSPRLCAEFQRDVWSIGSHGGVIGPMVASLLADGACQGLGVALERQNLTHRSENVASALIILVPLLHGLLRGADPSKILQTHSRHMRLPKVTGAELFAAYRAHKGPGNIPRDETWRLHTELSDEACDIERFVAEHETEEEACKTLATACYPEHGLPLALYLARKHGFDLNASLLANANIGGDNVHRGMILGMLVGAAAEEGVAENLKNGLADSEALSEEIVAFANVAVTGRGV
jgi:ADP-ribosyl-[dinitrogen reductase] hydrolase